MDMDVVEAAQRRSRWRVALWLGLAFFGLLSLIPLGWGVVRWRTGREVAAEKERVRAAEEPVTLEEVVARIPPIPPEQDCTALFDEMLQEAWENMGNDSYDPFAGGDINIGSIPPPKTSWQGLSIAKEKLTKHQKHFDQLRFVTERNGQARTLGSVDILQEPDNKAPIFTASTHADILELRLAVALHLDNTLQAIEILDSLQSLSRLCSRDPLQIGLLVRLGIDTRYYSAVGRLVGAIPLDDAQLLKLQDSLRSIDYLPQLREAVLSERAFGAQAFAGKGPMFETPAGGIIEGEEDLADYGMMDDRPVWWWTFTSHLDEWQYWQTMRRMCDATQEKDFQLIAREFGDAGDELYEVAGSSDFFAARYKVSLDTADSVESLLSAVGAALARNRSLDAFLACERYRLAHGTFPDSLEQIVPQFLPSVPTDPFGGKPLKYRRDGEEIVVYSVGEDMVDNRGGLTKFGYYYASEGGFDIGVRSNDWQRSYEEHLANPVTDGEQIGVDYDFGLDDDVD